MKRFGSVFLMLSALLLASCGAPSSQSGQGASPTTGASASQPAASTSSANAVQVEFWHGQSGVLGEALDKRVAAFNSTHPNIQVKAEFIGNWTELNQKILAAAASHTLPTMAQVGLPYFVDSYLQQGLITPVQDFIDAEPADSALLADFYPGFVQDSTFSQGGKDVMASWPFAKAVTVTFYNPDLLKQAGYDTPAATWDEFRTQSKDITSKTSAVGGLGWTPETDRLFPALVWSFGGQLIAPDYSEVRFNSPQGVAALQYLVDLVNDGTLDLTRSFDWQTDFQNARVAYGMSTIVGYQYIKEGLTGFTLKTAPLPAGPAGQFTSLYGPNAVIFADAPKDAQSAAWEFLKWWVQPENTLQWSQATLYVPVRKSVVASSDFQSAMQANPTLKTGLDSLSFAKPLPNRAKWAEIGPILTDAVNKAVLGQADPQSALDDAAKQANAILAGN